MKPTTPLAALVLLSASSILSPTRFPFADPTPLVPERPLRDGDGPVPLVPAHVDKLCKALIERERVRGGRPYSDMGFFKPVPALPRDVGVQVEGLTRPCDS